MEAITMSDIWQIAATHANEVAAFESSKLEQTEWEKASDPTESDLRDKLTEKVRKAASAAMKSVVTAFERGELAVQQLQTICLQIDSDELEVDPSEAVMAEMHRHTIPIQARELAADCETFKPVAESIVRLVGKVWKLNKRSASASYNLNDVTRAKIAEYRKGIQEQIAVLEERVVEYVADEEAYEPPFNPFEVLMPNGEPIELEIEIEEGEDPTPKILEALMEKLAEATAELEGAETPENSTDEKENEGKPIEGIAGLFGALEGLFGALEELGEAEDSNGGDTTEEDATVEAKAGIAPFRQVAAYRFYCALQALNACLEGIEKK